MGRVRAIAAAAVVLSMGGTASAEGAALDLPAFTATPRQLLADAKATPRSSADADVVVLRDETTLSFDEAGRGERRHRLVFVVDKQSGVDGWGTMTITFRPFYQQ